MTDQSRPPDDTACGEEDRQEALTVPHCLEATPTLWLNQIVAALGLPKDTARAVEMVLAERRKQVRVLDYDPDHDDLHTEGELAIAAACFLTHETRAYVHRSLPGLPAAFTDAWPWEPNFDTREEHTHFKNVLIGVALGLAEAERLLRKGDKL